MTDFFTADTHLGHFNIIKYTNRPFKTADEMDAVLINNINEIVMPDDTLYHLGDVAFKGAAENMAGYRSRINCKNVLVILGNHDKEQVIRRHFTTLPAEYMYVRKENPNDFRMVLAHYAHRIWEHAHHGASHLYGHSHGGLSPACGPDGRGLACFDIGVDCWDYKPLSLKQVRTEIGRRLNTIMTSVPHESNRYPTDKKEHHGAV